MLVTIQFRRGTAAQWNSVDPILALAEPGFDTTSMRIKFGDGVSHWTELEWTTPTPTQMAQLIELLEEAGDLDDGRMTNVILDVDSDFRAAVLDMIGVQVPSASTTVQGKVELATNAEAAAGSDTVRAITPGGLRYALGNGQIASDLSATFGYGSDVWLKSVGGDFGFVFTGSLTVDATTGLPTAGAIKWPDGRTGVFAATVNADYYTGFTATYVPASGPTRTLTATGITYDAASGLPLGPTGLAVS